MASFHGEFLGVSVHSLRPGGEAATSWLSYSAVVSCFKLIIQREWVIAGGGVALSKSIILVSRSVSGTCSSAPARTVCWTRESFGALHIDYYLDHRRERSTRWNWRRKRFIVAPRVTGAGTREQQVEEVQMRNRFRFSLGTLAVTIAAVVCAPAFVAQTAPTKADATTPAKARGRRRARRTAIPTCTDIGPASAIRPWSAPRSTATVNF